MKKKYNCPNERKINKRRKYKLKGRGKEIGTETMIRMGASITCTCPTVSQSFACPTDVAKISIPLTFASLRHFVSEYM